MIELSVVNDKQMEIVEEYLTNLEEWINSGDDTTYVPVLMDVQKRLELVGQGLQLGMLMEQQKLKKSGIVIPEMSFADKLK